MPIGRSICNLCPQHSSEYLKGRFQLKCAWPRYQRLGLPNRHGPRLCVQHGEEARLPSARRSSRSRLRAKEADPEEDEEPKVEGVRRRGRMQVVALDAHESEYLLEEMRGEEGHEVEPARKKKPRHDGSPVERPGLGFSGAWRAWA